MDTNLEKICKNGDIEQLNSAAVKSLSLKIILSVVEKSLANEKEPLLIVRAVYKVLNISDEEDSKKAVGLFKYLVRYIGRGSVDGKLADEVVWMLLMECHCLIGSCLAELAQFFVDFFKSGAYLGEKAICIFPKILSVIESQDEITYQDMSMKGPEYKSHLLNVLCSCKWSPEVVLHLAAMFFDVQMNTEELRFVLSKILGQLDDLDLRNIPSLVHRLLLLSEKGLKRMILEGIISFFAAKDALAQSQVDVVNSDSPDGSVSIDILRQTEGTTILYISFAIMEHRDLGHEFVGYLKTWKNVCTSGVFSPFKLALALSVAGKNVWSEQILDFLKGTILCSYRDSQRIQQSYSVREIVSEQHDVGQIVMETADCCSSGWDSAAPCMVQLGFLLIASSIPRSSKFRLEPVVSGNLSPVQSLCHLGRRVLLKMFKGYQLVRSDILGRLFDHIMAENTVSAHHYLGLLTDIVKSAPLFMLDSIGKVREMFDSLPLMPSSTAHGLLVALLPLLKVNTSLKDSLILILRKSIFSRQLDECRIGLEGYLSMLKSFKVVGGAQCSQSTQSSQFFSASQVPEHVSRMYNRSSNEALCLEILGILRKCLYQPADIRLILYQGLVDTLVRNSQLKSRIMDMLHSQLMRYCESDEETLPPLKLDSCISRSGGNVFLLEPLAHLLSCVQQCVRRIQSQTSDCHTPRDVEVYDMDVEEEYGCSGLAVSSGVSKLGSILDSLSARMAEADLEDFELDKSANFSSTTSVGVRNSIHSALLLGSYEVLMEHTIVSGEMSVQCCQHVAGLFRKYTDLLNVIRGKSGASAKKGKSAVKHTKTPNSLLTFTCVVDTMSLLMGDESRDTDDSVSVLGSNTAFLCHLVAVALQKLQQISEHGKCDGTTCTWDKLFQKCCIVGRVFLNYYTDNKVRVSGRDRHRVVTGSLEGLLTVITIATNQSKEAVIQCLRTLENSDDQAFPDVHKHIKRFEHLVTDVESQDKEERHMKDVGSLLTIISILTEYLEPDGPQYEQVVIWATSQCQDANIDDVTTSKLLMVGLLKLSVQTKSFPIILKECLEDIHSQLGDIEQDVVVDGLTHFAVINERSAAPHVLTALLPHMDAGLDNIDWVIKLMKADHIPDYSSDDFSPTQQETFEKTVCSHLALLASGLHDLAQSAIPSGPCVAATFKTLSHFYNTVLCLAKYFLHLYTSRRGHMSSRFEKLVKQIGTRLTCCVYNFITYVQISESEQLDGGQHKEIDNKQRKKKISHKSSACSRPIVVTGGKQDKLIPGLIFSIEELEKHLVKLGRKAKVNLMENIKTSTSRDFRINVQIVQESLQVSSDGDDEDGDDDDGDVGANENEQDVEQNEANISVDGDDEEIELEEKGVEQNVESPGINEENADAHSQEANITDAVHRPSGDPPPKRRRLGRHRH